MSDETITLDEFEEQYRAAIGTEMDLNDQTYHLIKDTPKVTGFLGTENKPIPIT